MAEAANALHRTNGFKRIGHYSLLGPASKAVKLAQARAALSAPALDPLVVESVQDFMRRIHRIESMRYAHCGKGHFVPTAPIAPSALRMLRLRGPP